jgi:hypothetical protein
VNEERGLSWRHTRWKEGQGTTGQDRTEDVAWVGERFNSLRNHSKKQHIKKIKAADK